MKKIPGLKQLLIPLLFLVPFAFLVAPPTARPLLPYQGKEVVKKLELEQKNKVGPHNRGTGYKAPTKEQREKFQKLSVERHGNRIAMAAANLSLPEKYDDREKTPIPVGDQGSCGSCYLYSTMWYTFTNAGIRAGYGKAGKFILSVQWGMDHPRNFGGCGGGWGQEVAEYVVKNGCIAETWVDIGGTINNDYPTYQASSGQDRTKSGAKVWSKGWTWGLVSNSNSPTVEEIKAAMVLYGRLNVALDAGGQFGTGTGTITQLGTSINHEISMCAYDDTMANPDGSKGAFLLENQWSKNWGINGYRWITYKASKNLTDIFWVSAGVTPPPQTVTVPGVIGNNLLDATNILKSANLIVGPLVGDITQRVILQSPSAATEVVAGSAVGLTFGTKPPPDGKAPFKLYEGDVPNFVQVGEKDGYTTFPDSRKAASIIATADKKPVSIWDSSMPAVLMEVVKPDSPIPPGEKFVIQLTPAQVDRILRDAGALVIHPRMTLQEIIDQAKTNSSKKE